MGKFFATIKAIITRLVFSAHGFVGIWQVTIFKQNSFYWYLTSPILLLFFEGVFTLAIKETQEWKWFCPSVFLYLASIVPAIWLLELDKVDRRLRVREESFNLTALSAVGKFKDLNNLIGVQIKLPEIATETWITLIEQFLMLILIIGRWMLPKGDLTRDQLSQLLLVYIGTAADIIEFFDSFKDDKIASEPILVLLTLTIWSWSLMQFTVVLTATKSRKSRLTAATVSKKTSKNCCTIDVWGIALNILLQDAPFLTFRLLLILHFKIISYMNVFFTCKNTLVIVLQLYRLYVINSEHRKSHRKRAKKDFELTKISIIDDLAYENRKKHKKRIVLTSDQSEDESDDFYRKKVPPPKPERKPKNNRKDTGYSTASSNNSKKIQKLREFSKDLKNSKKNHKLKRDDRQVKKIDSDAFSEESQSDISLSEKFPTPPTVPKKKKTKYVEQPTISLNSTSESK